MRNCNYGVSVATVLTLTRRRSNMLCNQKWNLEMTIPTHEELGEFKLGVGGYLTDRVLQHKVLSLIPSTHVKS